MHLLRLRIVIVLRCIHIIVETGGNILHQITKSSTYGGVQRVLLLLQVTHSGQ